MCMRGHACMSTHLRIITLSKLHMYLHQRTHVPCFVGGERWWLQGEESPPLDSSIEAVQWVHTNFLVTLCSM